MTTSSVGSSNYWNNILSNSSVSAPSSTGAGAVGSSTSASSASASQDLAQTFLTLLVAQMNNQDPLNPVDNSQLTTQMAQISTVTGINNLNSSVTSLLSQLQQSSAIQSAQLTGHGAMVSGSNLALASSTNSSGTTTESAVGGYTLASAASNVTVTVSDSSGNTVRTLNLGPQSAGFQDFTWDGTNDSGSSAAAGNYTFKVSATSTSGVAVTTAPYNLETVVGTVPQSDGSTQLMLSNGTQVPYSAIKQLI